MKKVLIVGGVAGGASTATRLRRLDESLEIVIFEKGEYVSFANCGLPYYIGDIIQNRESLLVQTPESLKVRFNLDVRVNSEVVGVNGKDKKVYTEKDFQVNGKKPKIVVSKVVSTKMIRNFIETDEKIYIVGFLDETNERKKGEFLSMEDLVKRTKLNKTVMDLLKTYNCVPELSATNQQTLF